MSIEEEYLDDCSPERRKEIEKSLAKKEANEAREKALRTREAEEKRQKARERGRKRKWVFLAVFVLILAIYFVL